MLCVVLSVVQELDELEEHLEEVKVEAEERCEAAVAQVGGPFRIPEQLVCRLNKI